MNIKNIFFDKDRMLKKEVKIAIVIDDYKLERKNFWCNVCLQQLPKDLMDHYEFVKDEIGPGVSKDTTIILKVYKLKEH